MSMRSFGCTLLGAGASGPLNMFLLILSSGVKAIASFLSCSQVFAPHSDLRRTWGAGLRIT